MRGEGANYTRVIPAPENSAEPLSHATWYQVTRLQVTRFRNALSETSLPESFWKGAGRSIKPKCQVSRGDLWGGFSVRGR